MRHWGKGMFRRNFSKFFLTILIVTYRVPRHVRRMHTVSEFPLEAVSIEQRHEKLKIFLLSIVRRHRSQVEMASNYPIELSNSIPLGVFNFPPKIVADSL